MTNQAPTTLLLDGIWGRPKRFEPLLQMIRAQCGPAAVHHYDSSGFVVFEKLGAQLVEAIRNIGAPVNLVAFSMGGMVVRAAHLLDPSLPIRRAAFMNSPFRGSWLAYLCPIGAMGQLRPNHEFIRRVTAAKWTVPTLTTWCPADTMVIPGRSACLPNAERKIRCRVPMHIWPIHSRGIWWHVVDFLSKKTPQSELIDA